ncbi:MAG: PH domain-containing protein [Shewanella sp.]
MAKIEFIAPQDYPELSVPLCQANWPPLNATERMPVDAKYHIQVQVEVLLISSIPAIVGLILLVVKPYPPQWLLLCLGLAWLAITTGFLWLRVQHAKRLTYCVYPAAIQIESGLWWQNITAMPISRLQHVSLSQNPLELRFGLCQLKCFSAGSGSAEINLPGLSIATAESLRQALLSLASPQLAQGNPDNAT